MIKVNAGQRLIAAKTKVDRWYDPDTKSWVVTLRDDAGNQIGDSITVGTRSEAMGIKKDHPSFKEIDWDAENEKRYGLGRPKNAVTPKSKGKKK